MTKGTPYMIMLTGSTRMMMLRARPELERIDAVAVRGCREEVEIWAPANGDEDAWAASELPASRADGPGRQSRRLRTRRVAAVRSGNSVR